MKLSPNELFQLASYMAGGEMTARQLAAQARDDATLWDYRSARVLQERIDGALRVVESTATHMGIFPKETHAAVYSVLQEISSVLNGNADVVRASRRG